MLSFKKLDVYQFSIKFLALAYKIIDTLPRGQSKLADQFRRAATSIPLNIAEAAGKVSPADAAHHYAIARGEAMECSAIIDVDQTLPEKLTTFEDKAHGLVAVAVAVKIYDKVKLNVLDYVKSAD